jgi:hypothetical protein
MKGRSRHSLQERHDSPTRELCKIRQLFGRLRNDSSPLHRTKASEEEKTIGLNLFDDAGSRYNFVSSISVNLVYSKNCISTDPKLAAQAPGKANLEF